MELLDDGFDSSHNRNIHCEERRWTASKRSERLCAREDGPTGDRGKRRRSAVRLLSSQLAGENANVDTH